MPTRSPLPLLTKASDSRGAILQSLLIATIVITALYVGREVLLPLALSILLAFVLTPPLLLLRRLKVPRIGAVAIVVAFAFAIIFALGWLLSREATQLAADLPAYQQALSDKVKGLREGTSASPVFKKAGEVLSELEEQLIDPQADGQAVSPTPQTDLETGRDDGKPIQVEIRPREPSGFELYRIIAGTVLPPLVIAGIVLIFVVFMLLQREDLRDRLIRLAGSSDMQRATTTMNDAAHRLSKFFLRQLLINSAYGAFITLALWAIGIPSPIVWGVLAALMRFVPFIGSYIAAIPPVLLAAMIDPGWSVVLLTLALYVVGEMTMGQVIEPLIFGHGTGVSPLALVVSTVFWTWLWGPLGLMLAMPLTVCLAVLGRHVEGLQFFDVLLLSQPALTPQQSFYQRTLSGDAAEATYQAELALKDESLQAYLGTVALGGLKLAERDEARGMLDVEQAGRIAATVKEMLVDLADFEPGRWFARLRGKAEKDDGAVAQGGLASLEAGGDDDDGHLPVVERGELAPGWAVKEPVLCLGGRSVLDEAAAAMLAEVLNKRGIAAAALPHETLSAGHIASLERTEAKLVCLSYLGLGTGAAHIRYLVRRLRRILPKGTLILVAYWSEEDDARAAKEKLAAAEADAYATSLAEAVEICVKAAKGELKSEEAAEEVEEPTPPPSQPASRRVA
ncbi:MAG: AI-2E family transporter [Methyloceanibacter sp.]